MKMLRCFCQRVFDVIIKAITVSQILFVSFLDHVQGMVDIINPFLCQIDLFRSLACGVCNKIVFAPNFVFRKLIQRNNAVQVFRLKGHIL